MTFGKLLLALAAVAATIATIGCTGSDANTDPNPPHVVLTEQQKAQVKAAEAKAKAEMQGTAATIQQKQKH